MMSEFGSAKRLPFVPAASNTAPIEGHANAVRVHVAGEKLHRIVDGQSSSHRATGRIDVHADVLLGVIHLQKEQLRDDRVGHVIVDRRAEKDDPIFQQPRVDVVRLLLVAASFDDVRHGVVVRLDEVVGQDHSPERVELVARSDPDRSCGEASVRDQEIKNLGREHFLVDLL